MIHTQISRYLSAKIKPLVAILVLSVAPAELSAQTGFPVEGYGVWDRESPNRDATPGSEFDYLKGAKISLEWEGIQPISATHYDFTELDSQLATAAANNQNVFIGLNVGPDAPDWIYESHGGLVPEVIMTNQVELEDLHGWTRFPYYPSDGYKAYLTSMINTLANHLRTSPHIGRITYMLVSSGSTGDEAAYKGEPADNKPGDDFDYTLEKDSQKWREFRLFNFELHRHAFKDGLNPKMGLAFNSVDEANWANEWAWLLKNIPEGFGVKGSALVRGHHLTSSSVWINEWKEYMVDPAELQLFSAAEMDQTWKNPLYQINEELGFYWGAIGGLNQGLSLWDITSSALKRAAETELETGRPKPSINDTFRFFNKYAGQIDPAISTRGFIALHEGLDSSDIVKFPIKDYGDFPAGRASQERYEAICADPVYSARGAKMDDPFNATRGQVDQRRNQTGYNDCGWEIVAGNYSRFITQINPDTTSIGVFRVGGVIDASSSPYSRFARSFETSSGKDIMYFDCADALFAEPAEEVTLTVTYYDPLVPPTDDPAAYSTWSLQYDAGGKDLATALSITNVGDGTWKTASVTLTDAVMQNQGPFKSDFALVNTDGLDDIFHMVEVDRSRLYVKEISYQHTDIPVGSSEPNLLIESYDRETGAWVPAINFNTNSAIPSVGAAPYRGSYADYLAGPGGGLLDITDLGTFGIDTENNTVWVILNHDTLFRVGSAPSSPVPNLINMSQLNGSFTLSYQSIMGEEFEVIGSKDLVEEVILPNTSMGDGLINSYTHTPPSGESKYFYRLGRKFE